jgi:hypothetical protein
MLSPSSPANSRKVTPASSRRACMCDPNTASSRVKPEPLHCGHRFKPCSRIFCSRSLLIGFCEVLIRLIHRRDRLVALVALASNHAPLTRVNKTSAITFKWIAAPTRFAIQVSAFVNHSHLAKESPSFRSWEFSTFTSQHQPRINDRKNIFREYRHEPVTFQLRVDLGSRIVELAR